MKDTMHNKSQVAREGEESYKRLILGRQRQTAAYRVALAALERCEMEFRAKPRPSVNQNLREAASYWLDQAQLLWESQLALDEFLAANPLYPDLEL